MTLFHAWPNPGFGIDTLHSLTLASAPNELLLVCGGTVGLLVFWALVAAPRRVGANVPIAALAKLAAIGRELLSSSPPPPTHALEMAAALFDPRGLALYLAEKGSRGFRLASAHNLPDAPDLIGGDDGAEITQGERWRFIAPLSRAGHTLGVLALGGPRPSSPEHERIGDAELFEILSAQLSLSLGQARLRAEINRLEGELCTLRSQQDDTEGAVAERVESLPGIVGASAALRRSLRLVPLSAAGDASVLITGETGTGKELVAQAIHDLSPRRGGPFVSVNCPAIPASLAESELFGHERGAFTGAYSGRRGKFELADRGTIFLDEVADLPLEIQAKLLRVLQERTVQRVGGSRDYRIDIRVVAATNRDLRAEARAGRFREDLYYRLAGIDVALPPLRARDGDVAMLAAHFLARAAPRSGRPIEGFSAGAMRRLRQHAWPGNVRELQSVVERAVLLSRGPLVRASDLAGLPAALPERSFHASIRSEKRRRILDALQQAGGNQAAAARFLGTTRSNLSRMMRTLEIEPPPRRQSGAWPGRRPSPTGRDC